MIVFHFNAAVLQLLNHVGSQTRRVTAASLLMLSMLTRIELEEQLEPMIWTDKASPVAEKLLNIPLLAGRDRESTLSRTSQLVDFLSKMFLALSS